MNSNIGKPDEPSTLCINRHGGISGTLAGSLGALAVVSLGMLLKGALDRTSGVDTTFFLPVTAVFIAALLFNYPAALFSIAVAAVEWTAFFLVGGHVAHIASASDIILLCLFVGVSLLIVWQTHCIRTARRSSDDLSYELGKERAASATLEEREFHYRQLIDGLPQLLWTSGPGGRFDFLNRFWTAYTGVEAAAGAQWVEHVHPEDRPTFLAVWRDVLATAKPLAAELRIRRHDGVYRWFDVRATPLRDAGGKVVRWFGSNLDIEDRRRAEQRFRRLYESNLIAIAFVEASGVLSQPNDALLEMLGYTREEYEKHGLNWNNLIAEEGRGIDSQQWAMLRKMGRCGPIENEFIRKDGRKISVLISRADVSPGEHDEGVAFAVDLRRVKHAEEALRRTEVALRTVNDSLEKRVRDRTGELEAQSERLRALALDLAETESRERKRLAKILHDHFQQLISAAKMKVGIMRRRSTNLLEVDSMKQTESLLEEAIDASRSLATELSPPVLHDAGLSSALEWLARRMEKNHGLVVRLDLTGWQEPDNEQIRTILFECIRELLFNVVKHSGAHAAELAASVQQVGLLHIRVVDTGKGFDTQEVELKRKPDASFGLFSIRERLGLVGGLMKIVSAPGRGTAIDLTVPVTFRAPVLAENSQLKSQAVSAAGGGPARSVRVLVADDHKLFREGLISLLNQESYLNIVGEAGDGEQAVDLARALRPDIMIVDVTMPKLNGVQVAAMVSREMPNVKIIGLSMHERDDMAEAMRNAGAVAYCAKSAPIETLVNILRSTAATGENGQAMPGAQAAQVQQSAESAAKELPGARE